MNSLAQSPQRGGSSDQQSADIITASEGRRNEEQQQQIVNVDTTHGAGDHSSDKAKDQDFLEGVIKNGIIVLCSLLATFCLQVILTLPGDIKPEQLQSKTMNIEDDQLKKLQYFLSYDVLCFFLSLGTILSITIVSSLHYKYSLYFCSVMMGALITAATLLLKYGLVLATNDSIANDAFVQGSWMFVIFLAILFIVGLFTFKEFRSYIKKQCS